MIEQIHVTEFVKQALLEDIGRGDLFFDLAPNKVVTAKIISKENGVIAGLKYTQEICNLYNIESVFNFQNGDMITKGDIILTLKAKANILLSIERTLLNIMQHASGIATNVRRYVDIVSKYDVKLLDTRKTRPLLRSFEKYAAKVGGAMNHRKGLDDCLMLKDTHLKTIDDLENFMKMARKKIPWTSKIEVECESIEMAKLAMKCGADIIMCDNMKLDDIKEVVAFRNEKFSHILIEASGNIDINNIESYAKTGVDAISSGSLIHQATWIDLSMRFD